jgi:hypothetical protein
MSLQMSVNVESINALKREACMAKQLCYQTGAKANEKAASTLGPMSLENMRFCSDSKSTAFTNTKKENANRKMGKQNNKNTNKHKTLT